MLAIFIDVDAELWIILIKFAVKFARQMSQLVKRFRIKPITAVEDLCKLSNNLYNQSLYEMRKRGEEEGVWMYHHKLREHMYGVTNLEGEINFKLMRRDIADYVVKQVSDNVKGFFKAIEKWKVHPKEFKAKPEFPNFHKRGGMNVVQVRYNHDCKISDNGVITFGCMPGVGIQIPQWGKYKDNITEGCKMVRILPEKNYMTIEVVYNVELNNQLTNNDNVAAIDFGIDNLATVVTPNGCYIFSGKVLKSYNQNFNKRLAYYSSIKAKQGIEKGTKRITAMYDKRNRYIDTFMHTTSRAIVDMLIEQQIGKLVVGRNKGWKQEVNIGKTNNQKFVQIPFYMLQSKLKYKCEMAGIEYVEQEESHTSKCDALAMEEIGHHEQYAGVRKKRGLFQSSTGRYINADQNGALNILRKNIGDEEYKEKTKGWPMKSPVRIKHPQMRNEVCNPSNGQQIQRRSSVQSNDFTESVQRITTSVSPLR